MIRKLILAATAATILAAPFATAATADAAPANHKEASVRLCKLGHQLACKTLGS